LSAITVAFCGIIGWLALLMPHAARALRPAHARGEPWALCALLGAIALVVIDTLCRSVADSEFPPGVALGALGAPAFLWALTRVLPK
jgi:iron complex transport system permease protein